MNNNNRRALLAVAVLAALPLLQGCATKIKASSAHNVAPSAPFSSYGRIVLKPVAYKPGYSGDPTVLTKVSTQLGKNLGPSLQQWNSRAENGRTLTIEPVVEAPSIMGTPKRTSMARLGSSGMLLRVTFRDSTGTVVAAPEFFQRGLTTSSVLTRVSKLASNYTISNYEHAVGGPTGDSRAPN